MKTKIHTLTALLIAGLLVLSGCQDPFEPPQTGKPADGEGLFSLNLGRVSADRTILPAPMAQNNFAVYALVFSSSGRDPITAERTNESLTEAVTLSAGTWSLTVTAYTDAGKTKPAAKGTLEDIQITSGSTTTKSLELGPVIETGAEGTFCWDIQYPEEVTMASINITSIGSTPRYTNYVYFKNQDGTAAGVKNNTDSPLTLNTGYYKVTVSLTNWDRSVGKTEYLHIYQNMESRFTCEFTQLDFPVPVDEFDLTDKIAAPVTNAMPVTAVAENSQYTGTVTWVKYRYPENESHSGAFAPGTVYWAIVTLTPKEGYIFYNTNWGYESKFTYTGSSQCYYEDRKRIVTIEFPKTADPLRTLITFSQIADAAPIITGPTIRCGTSYTTETLYVQNPGQYDSIKWRVQNAAITSSGDSFTLRGDDPAYNHVGEHFVSVEVVKDGVPYNKTVSFTVTN